MGQRRAQPGRAGGYFMAAIGTVVALANACGGKTDGASIDGSESPAAGGAAFVATGGAYPHGCPLIVAPSVNATVTNQDGFPIEAEVTLETADGIVEQCEQTNTSFGCWRSSPGPAVITVRVGDEVRTDETVFVSSTCGGRIYDTTFVFENAPGLPWCREHADCELRPATCCGCETTFRHQVISSPRNADDRCAGVDCVPCPPAPAVPSHLAAFCDLLEGGGCWVLDLRESGLPCADDSDCEVVPKNCCGWCGPATIENSYALTVDDPRSWCDEEVDCPLVDCGPSDLQVEAYCAEDSLCSLRVRPDRLADACGTEPAVPGGPCTLVGAVCEYTDVPGCGATTQFCSDGAWYGGDCAE